MYNKLDSDTKKELTTANTVEEVKGVLNRHGLTVDDEQAQKVLKDIQEARIWQQELSEEEMEHIQIWHLQRVKKRFSIRAVATRAISGSTAWSCRE